MRNRYVLGADLVLLAAATVGAFVLRFDLQFVHQRQEFWFYLIAALVVKVSVFYGFGLYHRYWRYATATDMLRVAMASTTAAVALAMVFVIGGSVQQLASVSRAVIVIDWLLTMMATGGIRIAIRLDHEFRHRPVPVSEKGRRRVLIVGAGNVGMMVARLAEQNPGMPMGIIGFLDDDPVKQRKVVYGHRVLGPTAALETITLAQQIDEVVIAMPTAPRRVVDDLCDRCDRIGMRRRVIPSMPSLLHGTLSVDDVREWRSTIAIPHAAPIANRRSFERLLVTGGAGFIGTNFVRYWLSTYPSSAVIVLDKLTYAGNPDNLAGLDTEFPGRFTFVLGDICDKEAVARCISEHHIDSVVNFAAESHVDRSLGSPDVFVQTNVWGTLSLLENVRAHPSVTHFHQVSTDEVYGQTLRGSFSEADPLETRSPYSASKAGADMLVLAYAASYGVSSTITRGSNNIGPYQYPEKAVPLFVTAALDHEPLPVYGDGLYVRDYQYVLDHCRGIDTVMRRGVAGEIYNLGGGNTIAAIDLARMIVKKLGRPESLIQLVADRAGQDRRYSVNCAKVKALGWTPQFTLEAGLDRTIRWYVDNEWWWRKIKAGEYQEYYARQLKWRLEAAVVEALSG